MDGSPTRIPPAPADTAPGPVAAKPSGDGTRPIAQDLFWGLAATVLLVALNLGFEYTPVGEAVGLWCDSLVQNNLIAPVHPSVRVVDISDLAPESIAQTGVTVAPREKLKSLIAMMASFKPLAIGVDIDFAPHHGMYDSPDEDPAFFKWVIDLSAKTHVPIYLAASGSMRMPPALWLGGRSYRSIAASALLPNQKRTLFSKIGVGDEMGPTMSGALAAAALASSDSEFVRWPAWLANQTTSWKLGQFVAEQYIVDYSTMYAIKDQTLNASTPADVATHGAQFHNRVVIMGDATEGKTRDTCVLPASVPGVNTEHAQPCVYVQASGVFTLLQAPLYRLTFGARILIDVVLSVIVLGAAAATRLYFQKTSNGMPPPWIYGGGFALAALVVLASAMLVRSTRLVWDDFALVIVAFSMHSSAEHKLSGLKRRFSRSSTTSPQGQPAAMTHVD